MFESLKAGILNVVGNVRPHISTGGGNSQLATAVLLTRVTTVHCEMSETRREMLCALLKSGFGIDDNATTQLIEQAANADRNSVDLYRFTRQLNEVLDEEQRLQTIRMMWQMAYAEGNANEFEVNIIWRAAELLGVSSRQRIELRQLVSADNAALSSAGVGLQHSRALASQVA